MTEQNSQLERESAELRIAQQKGGWTKFRTYLRLAGPGWLQSALMLGGGSLAGSLYLGVLTGVNVIWLQPLAMILTIIMFGTLSYVVLSSKERPFKAINEQINPVLGWSWALAALASCVVWAMPQYALATGVLQQNLFPGLLGVDGLLGDFPSTLLIVIVMFIVATSVTWRYTKPGTGVKVFDWILKIMIYIIVACFIGVVVRLALLPGGLDWTSIRQGLIPDPSLFFNPAAGFIPLLEAIPAVEFRDYWAEIIVSSQRQVMIAVVAAAGGVNATFLMAYSLLRRGWGKEYRGLTVFDLSTGMLIPFAIATTCVIIAGSHQFHTVPQPGFVSEQGEEVMVEPTEEHVAEFEQLLRGRVLYEADQASLSEQEITTRMEELPEEERRMAATLLTRDAFDLAASLEPLTGSFFARIVFGIGVLGMTISSVVIHMLVSGMVICEMLGRSHSGWTMRIGSLAAGTGVLGPFVWDQASFWLAIPTSIFAFILLPSAYLTFYLMLNKRSLMGSEIPTGKRAVILNIAIILIILLFTVVSVYVIHDTAGAAGIMAIVLFLAAIVAGHFWVKNKQKNAALNDNPPVE